jgi:hypothetical protein
MRYRPPVGVTNRAIALTNAMLLFEGGNLSESFTNLVLLTQTNKVVNLSGSNQLSMMLTVSNGVFSGSVKAPGGTRTNVFRGVLLQDGPSGAGYLLGTNQTSRVLLQSLDSPWNPFAGTYAANYTGLGTTNSLTVAVQTDGNASVVLKDATAGLFTGSGTVTADGALNATAMNTNSALAVQVSGQFTNQSGLITVDGSANGDVSVPTWTGQRIAGIGINAFAGNWSGNWSGPDSAGTWTGVLSNDGILTGVALNTGCGQMPVVGTISLTGLGYLQGAGTASCPHTKASWQGVFFLQGNEPLAEGTWTSTDGGAGLWTGHR